MRKYLSHTFFFFLFAVLAHAQQTEVFKEQLDSIQLLRKLSENSYLDTKTRFFHAKKAVDLSHKIGVDSIMLYSYKYFIEASINNRDFSQLDMLAHRNLRLAKKYARRDIIAHSSFALGRYHASLKKGRADSANYYYSIAKEIYESEKDNYNIARILYYIAIVQCYEKGYIESETISIKALSILNKLKETNDVKKLKSFIYNNLGIVFNETNQFEDSIKYQKLSLELKKRLKGDYSNSIFYSWNNLGVCYSRYGKYDLAIECYMQVLKNINFNKDRLSIYVMVLDNYAHTLFLSKNLKQLPGLYLKALKVSDSIGANYESIIIHQNLAEYYEYKMKKDSALYHGYKALKISKQFYNDDVLKSLMTLARVEEDSIAVKHYETYIRLNDSIQLRERLKRNKNARIQYETDQYIKKTKLLSTQNVLVIIIAMILILLTLLIYFIKRQQTKHELLIYEREQQEATQQIYELLLNQQSKLEEGRLKERHRISEEVHDGILSHLFGARLGLGFLPIEGDTETKRQFQDLLGELQEVEREMRDISHKLKQDDSITATNFEALLKEYVATQSKRGRINYKIDNSVVWEKIPNTVKIALYRLVQEAMKNIITHAKAKMVTIDLKTKEDKLEIKIIDNGIGFDAQTFKEGIGLRNMASRIEKLKGEFTIISQKELGTTIQCSIPIIRR